MTFVHPKTDRTSSWEGSGHGNIQLLEALHGDRRDKPGLTRTGLKVKCKPFI